METGRVVKGLGTNIDGDAESVVKVSPPTPKSDRLRLGGLTIAPIVNLLKLLKAKAFMVDNRSMAPLEQKTDLS